MWWQYKMTIYQTIICLASIIGLVHYKIMDRAFQLLVIYMIVTFCSEGIAIYCAYVYKNNLPIYHVYALVQYLLLAAYYIHSLKALNRRKIKWLILILGVFFTLVNTSFIQHPLKQLNTNFIVFESFVIILLSLYSFYYLIDEDNIDVKYNPNFWITSLLLIFWSFTFFYWLVGVALYNSMINKPIWLDAMITAINLLTYSGFGIIFLLYPKMKTK